MPRPAAAASPLATATGVAMTRAHGQAMTSTTRPRKNQSCQPTDPAAIPEASPTRGGPSMTAREIATTAGV